MLLIVTPEGDIAGHIEFFRPVSYWDAFELSYQLYDDRHTGHDYATEAVQLLVDYLFATKKEHRIHLGASSGTGSIGPPSVAPVRHDRKAGRSPRGHAAHDRDRVTSVGDEQARRDRRPEAAATDHGDRSTGRHLVEPHG